VEEHFQVNAFDSAERRRGWGSEASRVERNTEKILELLDRHRATRSPLTATATSW
jgi:hypothetical protein